MSAALNDVSQTRVTFQLPPPTSRTVVSGLLYLRTAGSWVLGDASVTETDFVFDGPTVATQRQLPLDSVARVSMPCALQADFEVHVLVIELKRGEKFSFRALNRGDLSDFVDTVKDVLSGDYGTVTPPYSVQHNVAARDSLQRVTPLQTHLIAAVKARHEEFLNSSADTSGRLALNSSLSPSWASGWQNDPSPPSPQSTSVERAASQHLTAAPPVSSPFDQALSCSF
jgi:hypothetical protein